MVYCRVGKTDFANVGGGRALFAEIGMALSKETCCSLHISLPKHFPPRRYFISLPGSPYALVAPEAAPPGVGLPEGRRRVALHVARQHRGLALVEGEEQVLVTQLARFRGDSRICMNG